MYVCIILQYLTSQEKSVGFPRSSSWRRPRLLRLLRRRNRPGGTETPSSLGQTVLCNKLPIFYGLNQLKSL